MKFKALIIQNIKNILRKRKIELILSDKCASSSRDNYRGMATHFQVVVACIAALINAICLIT